MFSFTCYYLAVAFFIIIILYGVLSWWSVSEDLYRLALELLRYSIHYHSHQTHTDKTLQVLEIMKTRFDFYCSLRLELFFLLYDF